MLSSSIGRSISHQHLACRRRPPDLMCMYTHGPCQVVRTCTPRAVVLRRSLRHQLASTIIRMPFWFHALTRKAGLLRLAPAHGTAADCDGRLARAVGGRELAPRGRRRRRTEEGTPPAGSLPDPPRSAVASCSRSQLHKASRGKQRGAVGPGPMSE